MKKLVHIRFDHSVATPSIIEKESGIQWETLRDLIQWNRVEPSIPETEQMTKNAKDDLSSDNNSSDEESDISSDDADYLYSKMACNSIDKSFDELSRCRIEIPRQYMNDTLTDFIRYRTMYIMSILRLYICIYKVLTFEGVIVDCKPIWYYLIGCE